MIVKKRWVEDDYVMREGYFLFGFIPLFVRDLSTRIKFHATRIG